MLLQYNTFSVSVAKKNDFFVWELPEVSVWESHEEDYTDISCLLKKKERVILKHEDWYALNALNWLFFVVAVVVRDKTLYTRLMYYFSRAPWMNVWGQVVKILHLTSEESESFYPKIPYDNPLSVSTNKNKGCLLFSCVG